jgi:hypothetical protein
VNGQRVRRARLVIAGLVLILMGLGACTASGGSDDTVERSDDGTTSGLGRASVVGLTFLYPAELLDVGDERPDARRVDGPSVAVRMLTLDERLVEATVSARTLRDRTGSFLADVTDEDRALAIELESGENAGRYGVPIRFVNGAGHRVADTDSYSFTGITTDGAQLVKIWAKLEADGDEVDVIIERMDEIARSLFVDGSSPVLTADECVVDVWVTSEEEIEPGREVRPGATVTATWGVRNSGTCPWTAEDGWVFTGGDSVIVTDVSGVAGVRPGDDAVVTVMFSAPDSAGSYATQWQFLPGGRRDLLEPAVPVVFEVVPAAHE